MISKVAPLVRTKERELAAIERAIGAYESRPLAHRQDYGRQGLANTRQGPQRGSHDIE